MYIADRVNVPNNRRVEFEQHVQRLEDSFGAPVRVLQPEAKRTVEGHTRAWSGASALMEHYPGYTEQERDEKGLTILFSSYNEAHMGRSRWLTLRVPVTQYDPPIERGEDLYWEIHRPEITADQVREKGGEPLVFQSEEYGEQLYGEMYEGRVMFVHFAVNYVYEWNGNFKWDETFDMFMQYADPAARAAAQERERQRNRELFTQIVVDQGNAAVLDLRQQGAELTREKGELQERLVNLDADHKQVGEQLHILLTRQAELTDDEVKREWDALERNTQVERFVLGRTTQQRRETVAQRRQRQREERDGLIPPALDANVGYLKLYTKMLYITNPDNGREMPLGKMELVLDFGSNTLRIFNLTHKQENVWDHPHVNRGELCAADFRTTITQLLRQRKIAAMAAMVFNILRVITTEHDDWGRNNILTWEAVDDRWRQANGHPEWTADEEVHPLKAQEEAEAAEATEPEQPEEQEAEGDTTPDGDDNEQQEEGDE